MQGVPINSPDILKDIPERERHIIICIKGYNGVVNQLKDMGIMDYHIYDPGMIIQIREKNRWHKDWQQYRKIILWQD